MWITLCEFDSKGRVIQLNLIHLVSLLLHQLLNTVEGRVRNYIETKDHGAMGWSLEAPDGWSYQQNNSHNRRRN